MFACAQHDFFSLVGLENLSTNMDFDMDTDPRTWMLHRVDKTGDHQVPYLVTDNSLGLN